jgi:hypothetical protein
MTLAELYAQNARQCTNAAERAGQSGSTVTLLRVACDWWQAAAATTQTAVAEQRRTCLTADGYRGVCRRRRKRANANDLEHPALSTRSASSAVGSFRNGAEDAFVLYGQVLGELLGEYAAANDMPHIKVGKAGGRAAYPLTPSAALQDRAF